METQRMFGGEAEGFKLITCLYEIMINSLIYLRNVNIFSNMQNAQTSIFNFEVIPESLF